MASKQSLKAKLFERGALAASHTYKDFPENAYACPLCGLVYPEPALQAGVLTLEHVPPKALGGKVLCLTCRDCNSHAGAQIDHHAVARRDWFLDMQTITGAVDRQMRGQLTIDDLDVNVNVVADDGTVSFVVLPRHNHPERGGQLQAKFEAMSEQGTWDGQELSVTSSTRYHQHAAKVADLRAAYLAAFALLGYRYAFHPQLAIVREQIASPKDKIIDEFWSGWQADSRYPALMLTETPTHCLVTLFERSLVFLPWPFGHGPDNLYQWIAENLQQGQPIKMKNPAYWPEQMTMGLDLPATDQPLLDPTP